MQAWKGPARPFSVTPLERLIFFAAAILLGFFFTASAQGQTPTGSIEGIVTDPSGAAIPKAKITITQAARGVAITAETDDSGTYAASALEPGDYVVQIEAPRFKTGILNVHVNVGRAADGNIVLQVGEIKETVSVSASQETQIDTTRNTVGGVITQAQLENLPVDGRNFLELAALEPGVQVVDAGSLEVTKTGFTAVSVAGSEGRTTRIQVDGIDITDEVVGTTTQNFSMDSISSFQISQFTLDPSTSLSNTGAVNIVTRSGSNEFHGSAYTFWRDHSFASRIVSPLICTATGCSPRNLDAPFHRVQGGVSASGPLVKDRAFFFLNYEQTAQHNAVFIAPFAPFENFAGVVVSPFPEHLGDARLDWNASSRIKLFARYSDDSNHGVTDFGGNSVSPLLNKNNTNSEIVGADVTLSRVTHSLRYGHLNFADYLDPASPPGIPPIPLQIVFDDTQTTFGPNFLAHEHSLQTNDQLRYDGSYVFPRHVLQYGANYSHIVANLFGAAFSTAPLVDTATTVLAGPDPTNPLNYVPFDIIFGNGLGSFSTKPSHGYPFGGITNNRVALYLADSYKTERYLTINFGIRWEVDPGQVNHDIVRPALLDTVVPNESGREPIQYKNFSPTFGLAWNVGGQNTTVIRAGAGIYYETNIFENVLFDRANFLPINIAPRFPLITTPPLNFLLGPTGDVIFDFNCAAPAKVPCPVPGTPLSMLPLATSSSAILAAETQFQTETTANLGAPSNGFISLAPPNALPGTQNTVGAIFDRRFTQPYSLHTNFGVQRRLGKNWLVQADFVRNRGVHVYLVQDANHVGAAKNLNIPIAQGVISATNSQFGCGTPPTNFDQASTQCAIGRGANIFNYALNGLDRFGAFTGDNPNFGLLQMAGTQGLSSYRALQVKVTGRAEQFGRMFHSASWEVSYALSRFEATQPDQANTFHAVALNNNCATCLFGPTGGDHTHQLAANTIFTLPFGLHWNTVTHLASPLPVTLRLPRVSTLGFGVGEIFLTDIDGDGLGQEVLPGTNIGSYGRSIQGVSGLNAAITNFSSTMGNQLTPAGQALVTAGLFTQAQLVALCAITPSVNTPPGNCASLSFPGLPSPNYKLSLPPGGEVTPAWFWTTDFRLSKTFGIGERWKIEPAVEAFNVFNRVNFDPIDNLLSGVLSGAPGTVNGTTPNLRTNVYGLRTGAFSPGIPRALQVSLRINF